MDPVQVFTVAVAADGYRCSVTLGSGREFTFNQRVFSARLCEDEYLRPLGFWRIDPRSTFLMACQDATQNPVILGLNHLDVEPGDRLLFSLQGYFNNGNEDGYHCCAGGVFSATSTLLAADNRYRVPDAISVGENGVGGHTWNCGNLDTNIPEGFDINPFDEVTVPANAAHLFLGVVDMLYWDNSDDDGNYGVEICIVKSN